MKNGCGPLSYPGLVRLVPGADHYLRVLKARGSGGLPRPSATIAILALSLAACQTPATRTQTVEVKVPVAVQPIKPEQVPTVPAPLGPRPESASAAADILLADHCKWVAYGLLTDPLLRVSAGEAPKALPKYPECER
jgi:hypothetical protein